MSLGATLQVNDLGINHLLNDKALNLCKQVHKKMICTNHPNGITHGIAFMGKMAPTNKYGAVDDEYKQKWAAILNSLANSGLWTCGVLAGPSIITLYIGKTTIFTYPFIDPVFYESRMPKELAQDLNKILNWDCCVVEGEIGGENWDNFPTTLSISTLKPNKYPHKCPKCKSPCYLGFNQVDCSNGNCK